MLYYLNYAVYSGTLPIRGVFVIQDKDKKWIIDFLERFSVEYYVRVVELTEEDCDIMGLQIE